MDLNHYTFDTRWRVRAEVDEVFPVLSDIASYPRWWREVRTVHQLDRTCALAVVRSFLPYSLSMTMRQTRLDQAAGVIEASLQGDLDGISRWSLTAVGDGFTEAAFHEDVVANKLLLRLFAPIARPLFRANHTVMMRDGQRGLATYLVTRRPVPPTSQRSGR